MTSVERLTAVNLSNLAEQVLSFAKKEGASSAEVDLSLGCGFTSNVRMGEIDAIEYENNHELNVVVYFDGHKGTVSTTDLRPESLQATVRAACDIARYTEEDVCNGLAEKQLMAVEQPDLSLYHPWQIDAKQAVEIALECESLARSQDQRITNSDGVSVTNYGLRSLYANSHGFSGEVMASRHELSCVLIAEAQGEKERDYYYSIARDPLDLLSAELVAHEAVKRTIGRLGSRQLRTGSAPVLFCPEVARQLIGSFIGAISGGNLYRESSFLLGCLGQQIFSPQVAIYERPFELKSWGGAAFDGEGVATHNKSFVTEGVLQSYCLDSYSARRLGLQTTANAGGPHNLIVESGKQTFSELLKEMGTGLLVTELMGRGVNLLTGDYSRGVAGFWVENGEIQYPVSEVTIAGNLREIFRQVVAIGNDVDKRSNIQTGSILIEQMTVAGS